MSDHLSDDLATQPALSEDARSLFRSARAEALRAPDKRAASLAALKTKIASAREEGKSIAAPPMPVSIFPARRSRFATRLLVAIAAVLVTAGSAAAVRHTIQVHRAETLAHEAALASASNAIASPAQVTPQAPANTSSAETPELPPDPSLLLDKPNVDHKSHTAAPASHKDGDTSEDVSLLGNARQALAANQPADALQFLDEDAKKFPASSFREDRAYERIRALCELGRTADAKSDATQFLKKWPSSMYATGVRRSCADL